MLIIKEKLKHVTALKANITIHVRIYMIYKIKKSTNCKLKKHRCKNFLVNLSNYLQQTNLRHFCPTFYFLHLLANCDHLNDFLIIKHRLSCNSRNKNTLYILGTVKHFKITFMYCHIKF